jgi:GNAT superfamily N-acetyltransferase
MVPATEADLPALAELAGVIWRVCYAGILPPAQIVFMLKWMYGAETLREEMRLQGVHFYRLLAGERFAGFAALGPTETADVMKLHKLYLLPELHGRGLGSLMLEHCQAEARRLGARRLILAVNKQNARAIAAYQRNGFAVANSAVTDIGGGFVMDDFIMGKNLPAGGRK